jgi:hypothetical protein
VSDYIYNATLLPRSTYIIILHQIWFKNANISQVWWHIEVLPTWETKTVGLSIHTSLGNLARPFLRIKWKGGQRYISVVKGLPSMFETLGPILNIKEKTQISNCERCYKKYIAQKTLNQHFELLGVAVRFYSTFKVPATWLTFNSQITG